MFEIYKAVKSRKTYLVSFGHACDLFEDAKKHYKCAVNRIAIRECWILNDELYLKDPHDKKAKLAYTAYLKKKGSLT